eukprot:CAMPEP_0178713304 /NCGR_PEP_ID=MMETSP0699-20121125/19342_1 /TAXON_ID=265572 /ORGANISM="Extubocellulus spinifer, Strain CCMP396" /LENGTH=637 /DNA_ID=CAMNT_0020362109 /DNA_START=32 /DNA_END=1945 /DNA_ORIENTATION=+
MVKRKGGRPLAVRKRRRGTYKYKSSASSTNSKTKDVTRSPLDTTQPSTDAAKAPFILQSKPPPTREALLEPENKIGTIDNAEKVYKYHEDNSKRKTPKTPTPANFLWPALVKITKSLGAKTSIAGIEITPSHIRKHGNALAAYRLRYAEDFDSSVIHVSVKYDFNADESQHWFSPIPIVMKAGIKDTVVFIKFSAATLKAIRALPSKKEKSFQILTQHKNGPAVLGIRVGSVLSDWVICKAMILVENNKNNMAEILTTAVRHRMEVILREEKERVGSVKKSSEKEKSVTSDAATTSDHVLLFNQYWADVVEEFNFELHAPPPNPLRIGWYTWPVACAAYDNYFLPPMRHFRQVMRDKFIRDRKIKDSDIASSLTKITLFQYFQIMQPSQTLTDEQCERCLYIWLSLGFHDAASFIEPLRSVPYGTLVKHYSNVFASQKMGMQALRAKSMLDSCICFYLFYEGNCPTKPTNLLCLPQIGPKKVKVLLNGFGIEKNVVEASTVGEDTHVKKMLEKWKVSASDIEPKLQPQFNDFVGEISQQLSRGDRESTKWAVELLKRVESKNKMQYSQFVNCWKERYRKKLDARIEKAKKEYRLSGEEIIKQWYECADAWLNDVPADGDADGSNSDRGTRQRRKVAK